MISDHSIGIGAVLAILGPVGTLILIGFGIAGFFEWLENSSPKAIIERKSEKDK